MFARRLLLVLVISGLISGCGEARYEGFRDASSGIAFRYPAGWFVTDL
jgi:hypothetical protein